MNKRLSFETSNANFRDVIGNGKMYEVPMYQRDYSWDAEQWNDLWEDLIAIYNTKKSDREDHYMGYLVLQKTENNTNKYKVIDGQQRLTTISLLVLAALQILRNKAEAKNEERLAELKRNFISTKSSISLLEKFKLKLNRNNDSYYRNNLANLTSRPILRNIKHSERLMLRAKEFFENQLKKQNFNSEKLSELIEDCLGQYLLFTIIKVNDEAQSYKIFETLNARGVKLSTPDLLKNYLFSLIDSQAENQNLIREQEDIWTEILTQLGSQDFSKFLRVYWNSQTKASTKTQLFRNLKLAIDTPEKGLEIISDLHQSAAVYAAFFNIDDELWNTISDKKLKEQVRECLYVLKTFSIAQVYPILLSAYQQYDITKFSKLCKYLTSFCIRYHAICSAAPNEVESQYNQIAIAIRNNESIEVVKKILLTHYPDNEISFLDYAFFKYKISSFFK